MKWRVSLGCERAYNADIEVEAETEDEAEELALKRVREEDWEEGDWESTPYVIEALEAE